MTANHLLAKSSPLIALGLVLAGCAPPAQAPTGAATVAAPAAKATAAPSGVEPTRAAAAPAPSPKSVAQEPRYGGILTGSLASELPSLDIQQESTIATAQAAAPAYNPLLEFNPRGDITPVLAEKWDVDADGKVYTFTVRQGIKWHDGRPLSADDVAWNIERLAKPPRGVRSNVGDFLRNVDKVEVRNDRQVVVTLSSSFVPFLSGLANYYAAFVPPHVVREKGDMKNNALGTGAFKLKRYTPGISIEFVKNTDYFIKGRPFLDGVAYYIVKDSGTRLAALRTGRVLHSARGQGALTPNELSIIKKEAVDFQSAVSPSVTQVWLFFNRRLPPFSDVRARRAMTLAIDRDLAVKLAAEGAGAAGRAIPIPGWGLPDAELRQLPGWRQPKEPDVAEARKLLGEVGFPSGFSLTIDVRAISRDQKVAEFVVDQLGKIGVKATMKSYEIGAFWDYVRNANHVAAVYAPARVVPDVLSYGRFFAPGGSLNYAGNDDDQRLRAEWARQASAVDPAERKRLVAQVERYLLAEDVTVAPAVEFHQFLVWWPQVRGFEAGITDYAGLGVDQVWLSK
ncbi:MAG: ABC transporter substrate-binding protein [Chloroflexi bacterium]|nr:ABC transporter substrate-binding protein [Chloroflexota bacterium]